MRQLAATYYGDGNLSWRRPTSKRSSPKVLRADLLLHLSTCESFLFFGVGVRLFLPFLGGVISCSAIIIIILLS